eukprot:CAMPEP_0181035768 /NCGR_PEP_ID=MMETSP1070-20121207/8495_1 /TAXON_ID=265543 /ORGANISM="Minutocellus polymorphus, Strain NH13" /LENGTH=428 /DNA_ID=CAMNT_0023113341 /DNA_START=104 /DNA_END=1390 /DNA_ORIENTATION=-
MGPPKQVKPKSKQQAMPSMLKSMHRSVTVASAAVDTAFISSAGGVGQRSSVVAGAQERHSLLANDGMLMSDRDGGGGQQVSGGLSSPDRATNTSSAEPAGGGGGPKAPKAPKLMKMASRHIRMKKMMDNIGTRLKLHSHGDSIAFGRRDRQDASGKSYNVEIPKNMIVLTLIAFFVMPLAFGLWVLFRQLFMSDEVHSRYQHHSSGRHPAAYHVTSGGKFSNSTPPATEATIADLVGNFTTDALEFGKSVASAITTTGDLGKTETTEDEDKDEAAGTKEKDDENDATNGAETEKEAKESSDADLVTKDKTLHQDKASTIANDSALQLSKVTNNKAEPADSDDQEEDINKSFESEGDEKDSDAGGADGDADAREDSSTEEELPGSNNGKDKQIKDTADLQESEDEESLEQEAEVKGCDSKKLIRKKGGA